MFCLNMFLGGIFKLLGLNFKWDEIKQHSLDTAVNIISIPKTRNEDCMSFVEDIGQTTNTKLIILHPIELTFLYQIKYTSG